MTIVEIYRVRLSSVQFVAAERKTLQTEYIACILSRRYKCWGPKGGNSHMKKGCSVKIWIKPQSMSIAPALFDSQAKP